MKKLLITAAVILVAALILNQFVPPEPGYSSNGVEAPDPREVQSNEGPSLISQLLIAWWWYILYYSLSAIFGVFVYRDARSKESLALNIGPGWWGVLVTLQPPLGILTYWLMHYSSLTAGSRDGA